MANVADGSMLLSALVKFAVLTDAALILGLPIVHTPFVVVVLAMIAVAALARVEIPRSRRLAWCGALTAAGLVAGFALPAIRVEEGHNLFLVDGTKHEAALRAALPAEIYDYAAAEFAKFYPAASQCSGTDGCWRDFGPITAPYAFTADGATQLPAMSREVDFPTFESPAAFRAAFRNAAGMLGVPVTNWFDQIAQPGDPARRNMPFFVTYIVPKALLGQRACLTGDWFFAPSAGPIEHTLTNVAHCRQFTAADIGGRLTGVFVNPGRPLAVQMQLKPNAAIYMHFARLAGRLVAAIALFVAFMRPNWSRLVTLAAVSGPPMLVGGLTLYQVSETPLFAGGTDQLLHWGFGERILQGMATGDWAGAAKGVEPVFYFQPGYRYFRAVEMLIFGDSGFLTYATIAASPFLLFTLAQRYGGVRLAVTFLPVVYIAFYYSITKLAGYAEVIGYPLAIAALLVVSRLFAPSAKRGWEIAFCAALLMALATLMRPNLGLLALVIAGAAVLANRAQRLPVAIASVIGLSPIGLMLVHNLYFGGQWVLASSSSSSAVVLVATPGTYLAALGQLLLGRWTSPELGTAAKHIWDWITGDGGIPLLVLAALLGYAAHRLGRPAVQRIIAAKLGRPLPRLLLASLICLEAPLLFYWPSGRFAFLAAQLGYLIGFDLALAFMDKAGIAWPPRSFYQSVANSLASLRHAPAAS